jgi:hypothetical protein
MEETNRGPMIVLTTLRIISDVAISVEISPNFKPVKVAARVVESCGMEDAPKNKDWVLLNPTIFAPKLPLRNFDMIDPATIMRVSNMKSPALENCEISVCVPTTIKKVGTNIP